MLGLGNWWRRFKAFQALDMEALRRQAARAVAEAEQRFCNVGLSVGQGAQPTGLAILEKLVPPRGPDGRRASTYVCHYLRRWRDVDNSYLRLAADLETITSSPAVAGCDLVVESGTSTWATVQYLRRHRLRAQVRPVEVRVNANNKFSEGAWRLGKDNVIELTRQVLQEGRLVFDEPLAPEAQASTPAVPTVYHALACYPYRQGPAANEAFAAREGDHDDLVLAIALACWYGERGQRQVNIWC